MKRHLSMVVFFIGVLISALSVGQVDNSTVSSGALIKVLKVEGVIGTVVADYISTSLNQLQSEPVECVILELNTPGGLEDSTQKIVEAIMQSDVPVVAYVAPEGARAASAGTFIVLSCHIAAMAPATNIGAAHPVGIQGSAVEEKLVNHSAGYIRSIAERRGRNADWAEDAVRKSVSISSSEAVKMNVIDLVADNIYDLASKIDGRKIQLPTHTAVLKTDNPKFEVVQPSWVQNFFQMLGHPNLAYILLIIGIWGIYFELANPGMVLPGVIGGISLILGLLSLSVLTVNYAGLLLIILAIILFVADLFTPTHGVLTVGGIIAFILGSFLLFPDNPYGRVRWEIILTATGLTTIFFGLVLVLVIKAQRSKVVMGVERFPGTFGVVQSRLNPTGVVHASGEQWSARSIEGVIEEGEDVEIVGFEGLTLNVKKTQRRNEPKP